MTEITDEDSKEVIAILEECQALLSGHFLLSSGRHSDKYFQCARLLQYPDKAFMVLAPLAKRLRADAECGKIKIDAVCGPAIGGIIVAYELARLLEVPAFFTERDDSGAMTLKRGFEVERGANILIAEDVITTGKSSMESIAVLEKLGAKVAALSCIVDRREAAAPPLELPLYAACKVNAGNWTKDECELCKQGVPAIKPGSRKIF
jgi:orotate phosphoribosyltransferase